MELAFEFGEFDPCWGVAGVVLEVASVRLDERVS